MKSIVVGGGGFQPGDFTFNNILVDETTNTVTFTKSGRLCITGISEINEIGGDCFINGNSKGFFLSTSGALSNPNSNFVSGEGIFIYNAFYGVFDININDTMYFTGSNYGSPFTSDQATVTFYLDTFTGTVITSFTITK